jgi:hypothetical protein
VQHRTWRSRQLKQPKADEPLAVVLSSRLDQSSSILFILPFVDVLLVVGNSLIVARSALRRQASLCEEIAVSFS